MIVWRGMGIVALLVAVVINVLVNESANALWGVPEGFKHYRDAHKWLWFAGMALSAVACWFLGRWLEARGQRDGRILVDAKTGESIRLVTNHDLFWIPVKWWAVVWGVAGVGLTLF